MISEEEVKLLTMANLPYKINSIHIQPKTLKEIVQVGYDTYDKNLNIISVRIEDLFPHEVIEQIPKEASLVEVLLATRNFEFLEVYLNSIIYFTNIKEIKSFSINTNDIEVINKIIKIVAIQNCVVAKDDEYFNPLNERAKKIKEKMLENKKKIQELKSSSSSNETLTLFDLISILCSKNENGINLLNVFDLNMMQFNDQINRMIINDEYEVNIQALLHGADSKEVKLKHWMSKL